MRPITLFLGRRTGLKAHRLACLFSADSFDVGHGRARCELAVVGHCNAVNNHLDDV
jgi:hypothetical protein